MTIKTKDNDKAYRKVLEELEKVTTGPFVKVGQPSQSEETKKERSQGGESFTNLDIAVVHEFGTEDGSIPERSHIRSSYDENIKKINKFGDKQMKKILDNKQTVEGALELIGLAMVANIQKKVRSGLEPPLKTRTGTPLLNTGQYVGSFTHVVIKDKKNDSGD